MTQATHSRAWAAPTATAPLDAVVHLPGSKSLTNRELVLAALADGPSVLRAPLHSRDSALMVDALRAMGVGVEEVGSGPFGPDLRVTPGALGAASVDCGLAGTVMRFLPIVAGLATGAVAFDGDPHARLRPNATTIEALRALGVRVEDNGTGTLPFTVHGTGAVRGGELHVDASASSQFVSALLLAAPRFDEGLTLRHTGERLPSLPHIDMTIATLRARGVEASSPERGVWRVEPGTVAAIDVTIEPDLSNAAPFLAAALVAGGRVTVAGWPRTTTQVGAELPGLLERLGASVAVDGDRCTVDGGAGVAAAPLAGGAIDMAHAGELAPTIAALGVFADAPLTIRGIGHIRGHETDRIDALVDDLARLGGEATGDADSITVHPGELHGGAWAAYADHRMATAGALLGLAVAGVEVDDIGATAKTIPEFPDLWQRMLLGR
ncbi:3-phosphoshikimate 1-carboxyvinyltransferase [Agrococcus sp. SGAir0287]|uniref:3-phosphoshikimate 1-carboxyvinyltransferase n=1 Tax=Agrococcus sp. SGAir0287 TaxID=2070347 RepID=UPI0010CD064E|nr:3-phosphoshikimate 1-carboxyvinyltransferase [Agrococcus sp. SGAir0287]QCR18945.1 3-phosphoshikimate 1-carboxyvinyltransferase [Agrococcus sp. SGAir0287]